MSESQENIIENSNGLLQSVTGPEAVEAFRLRAMLISLRFTIKTGMPVTRGFNIKKLVKEETGLNTNDLNKLEIALAKKLDETISKCSIITDGHQTNER